MVLQTLAGPEIGVASTKAFTTQLTVLASLALWAGRQRGTIDAATEAQLSQALVQVPALMADVLNHDEDIKRIAAKMPRAGMSSTSVAGPCSRLPWKAR